jgi:hypothetical protein
MDDDTAEVPFRNPTAHAEWHVRCHNRRLAYRCSPSNEFHRYRIRVIQYTLPS